MPCCLDVKKSKWSACLVMLAQGKINDGRRGIVETKRILCVCMVELLVVVPAFLLFKPWKIFGTVLAECLLKRIKVNPSIGRLLISK